jgi:DNA repair photolyase
MQTLNYKGGVLIPFDPWKSPLCTCPPKLSLNPYTGCSFKCVYCYATAYIGVKESTPKKHFEKRLKRDLLKYPPHLPINIGTSSDPYPPEELVYQLTRKALEILVPLGRRILITTKGTLYAKRDLDLLSKGNVAITPTITTLNPHISQLMEPGTPTPVSRISAIRAATKVGVPVGVRVDPIIPFINDDISEIKELIGALATVGVGFIVTSTYKAKPDNLKRLVNVIGGQLGKRIYKLYKEKGVKISGYYYLPKSMREKLLEPVIKEAKYYGFEYAVCREGLTGRRWFNAPSCDGTHLIPNRVSLNRQAGLNKWFR